ncbi:MAG: radical SAM protein [Candidatus Kapabacteria bacterium]|nr:radical SAM protein [Candidatus Kapabacteria bacterium]
MQQPTPVAIPTDDPLTLPFSVNEIFHSIQGEGTRTGMPCTFIRLQGCKLRCVWCDTPYALDKRHGGTPMTGADIVQAIEHIGTRFVEFTGGEPLEQWNVFPLITHLCDQGYTVAVETGGHVSIACLDPRSIAIIDVKCPDSRMESLNHYDNLSILRPQDEVKFVIASRADYEFARDIIRRYDLGCRTAAVLLSCAFDTVPFVELVRWMLDDKLPARFQLQVHKFVWSPETRGV